MSEAQALWDRLAGELGESDPAIGRSTMMGWPCLRLDGALFASFDKRTGHLVVKLAADDVSARVAAGSGEPFAPTGKVFREWVIITETGEPAWRTVMSDALSFAGTK